MCVCAVLLAVNSLVYANSRALRTHAYSKHTHAHTHTHTHTHTHLIHSLTHPLTHSFAFTLTGCPLCQRAGRFGSRSHRDRNTTAPSSLASISSPSLTGKFVLPSTPDLKGKFMRHAHSHSFTRSLTHSLDNPLPHFHTHSLPHSLIRIHGYRLSASPTRAPVWFSVAQRRQPPHPPPWPPYHRPP